MMTFDEIELESYPVTPAPDVTRERVLRTGVTIRVGRDYRTKYGSKFRVAVIDPNHVYGYVENKSGGWTPSVAVIGNLFTTEMFFVEEWK